MNKTKYHLSSFLRFFLPFIGFFGVKLTIVAVSIGIALLTEKYIGNFGLSLGYIVGLSVGGLLFYGLQRLSPLLENLENHASSSKKLSYTDEFGKDFPSPKPEDFGITNDDLKEYSGLQFQLSKLILTYGPFIGACFFGIHKNLNGRDTILVIAAAIMVFIFSTYLFDQWNEKILRKHRCYEKIKKYHQALTIYLQIRDENSPF